MGRSQNQFIKKKKAQAKRKKKQAKFEKRIEKKNQSKDSNLENMLAFVDENGNISAVPPDKDA